MKLRFATLAAAAPLLLAVTTHAGAAAPTPAAVLTAYADIAAAGYADAHAAAKKLQAAIDTLIAKPSDKTLAAARGAWVAARPSYQQTEAFRFGNKIVDDWEGKVNAWPLDEGLIDYVAGEYGGESPENELYAANVIANTSLKVGPDTLDTRVIDAALLEKLHEAGGVEANVAIGYHAIEFLLWGQDLNGTGPGAGNRPATDFDTNACTGGNCDRRAQYLKVVTAMLVDQLKTMADAWAAKGKARAEVTKGDGKAGLTAIFTGLGSLSYGELAGERMKLGLLLNDPEEEHDCFSDNTHNSHFYDAIGIRNVYFGTYTRTDGQALKGPSVSDLVRAKAPDNDAAVRKALDVTVAKMTALKERAEKVERYDQMIGQGNTEGNAVVQAAIDALIAQSKELERAMAVLGIEGVAFEGSDSLDAPGKIHKK
ncbi:MAG: peptidase [Hyphomicrobiaceae bacterium]|nr:peptidase [Hyphomicrobiaceae bacterium]